MTTRTNEKRTMHGALRAGLAVALTTIFVSGCKTFCAGHCVENRDLYCCRANESSSTRDDETTWDNETYVPGGDSDPRPQANRERVCRADSFFVEVPIWEPTPWVGRGFADEVARRLRALADGHPNWFVGSPSGLTVEPEWVLSSWGVEDVPTFREGGEDRFLRFRFKSGGEIVPVRDMARCAVVQELRAAVMNAVGLSDPRNIAVGRECDALPLSSGPRPGQWGAAADWPEQALLATQPANSELPNVDVALVDTSRHQLNGLRYASHGTAVANVITELAPGVNIDTYVAIEDGFATTQSLAAKIDEAVQIAYDSGRPTIINLSVGWPPHKSVRTRLTGPSCETWEDGVGESVRYALDVAHRVDANHTRVAAVSAAGNRWEQAREGTPGSLELQQYELPWAEVGQPYSRGLLRFSKTAPSFAIVQETSAVPAGVLFNPGGGVMGTPTTEEVYGVSVRAEDGSEITVRHMDVRVVGSGECREDPGIPALFYPAQLHAETTCRFPSDAPAKLSMAVGAVDHRYRASPISPRWGTNPSLVAPGQHVDVSGGGSTPVLMSGTSFAAAAVSGLAAQVQALALSTSGYAPLNAADLRRVLTATGRNCVGSGLAPMPTLEGIQAFFACPAAKTSCLGPNATPTACRAAVSSCGASLPNCVPAQGSLTGVSIPTQPTSQTPAASATTWVDKTRQFDFGPAAGEPRPPEFMPDAVALGSAGPQPGQPICTSCIGQFYGNDVGVQLILADFFFAERGSFSTTGFRLVVGPPTGDPYEILLPNPSPIPSGQPDHPDWIIQTTVTNLPTSPPATANVYALRAEITDMATNETMTQTEPITFP